MAEKHIGRLVVRESGLHEHKSSKDRILEEDLVPTLLSPYVLPANLARVLHSKLGTHSQLVHKQRSLGNNTGTLYCEGTVVL
jgi:hypothetical protein